MHTLSCPASVALLTARLRRAADAAAEASSGRTRVVLATPFKNALNQIPSSRLEDFTSAQYCRA